MTRSLPFLAILAALSIPLHAVESTPETLSKDWKFRGIILNEPGWDLWGASPVFDDQGNVHLYVERWPSSTEWEAGWRFHSEIAHYKATSPKGPFTYVETVLKPDPARAGWSKLGIHNSNIQRLRDGRYVLTFIARPEKAKTTSNQRIGMMIAPSPNGPWKPANGNMEKPMLDVPTDPAVWCQKTHCGVCNPALLEMPNGKFHLYFKASDGKHVSMGVAVADKVEGPYEIQKTSITANSTSVIEDGYAFLWNDKVCLITTDNHGIIENGGGLLWQSKDGLTFDPKPNQGFPRFDRAYLKDADRSKFKVHYTPQVKFERPQILMVKGAPRYLYVPSGVATDGSDGSNVHLLENEP